MEGKIKMVAKKGFGFITPDNGDADIFFHASNLKGVEFSEIAIGMPVVYDVVDGKRGLKAINIEVVS